MKKRARKEGRRGMNYGERTWKDHCSEFHFILLFKLISVTNAFECLGYVGKRIIRMLWSYQSIAVTLLVFTQALEDEDFRDLHPQVNELNLEQIQSPILKVLFHLPPNFHHVDSFKNISKTQQYKLKGKANSRRKRNTNQTRIGYVKNSEITQPIFSDQKIESESVRTKRDVEPAKELKAILEKPEPEKLMSSFGGARKLPIPDPIRGSTYTAYGVKEFDIVDVDDSEDPRRRRNDSTDDPDDNSQRDKRTFLEEGPVETTTLLPFWKRKKENPPFVTGRGREGQSGNGYTPAQHRSAENTRESHSMKNLDKTVQSNEISRSNQDNFYSATNRRTYSRQYDSFSSSTPKSVYDIIDYNQKKNQESPRTEFTKKQESRQVFDEKKEIPREARPTHEQYFSRQLPYSTPWAYERPYYQPAYPYPTEVFGRGVEYYHRTYDPSTGRIIYYANMPENGRSYDYRYVDSINRNFHINRPFFYDPYYRNYVPPLDNRFMNGFGRPMDYMRNGRSSSQAYSYQFQEREKFPRDAKFNGAFETENRQKDDFRNKTYIIFDADERSQLSRPQYTPYNNRPGFTPPPNNIPSGPQGPFRPSPFPSVDNFPPAAFPNRNQFYPTSGSAWGFSHRSVPGVADSNLNSRPPNSREIQLPLTTSNRGVLDKPKKT